jgi:hypothetical protein
MTLAQDVFAGSDVFHSGWYNVIDAALLIVAANAKRKESLALAGCAIVVFAGIACGLMAPDTHVITGAPGATVRDDQIGASASFPLSGTDIAVQRGHAAVPVGAARRYWGAYVMWQQPRDVVEVRVADARGNQLTVTQPTNASFLSPVLLMQQTTVIGGLNVRIDSFSVPAKDINAKAVLFSPQQAAQFHRDPVAAGQPAVLFVLSNRTGGDVPGGIGIVTPGSQKRIGPLLIGAAVRSYPALVVASAPYWPALLIGLFAYAAGAVRRARRTQTPS